MIEPEYDMEYDMEYDDAYAEGLIMEPEDCDECDCDAGEFGPEDYDCGAWKCPVCGAVQ